MFIRFLIIFSLFLAGFAGNADAQKGGPIKVPGYKFIKRIKGPPHKRSKVLEIMIDKYNNYFAATFRAENNRFIYVGVYRLYTWEEVGLYKLDVNRAELYCSVFDPDGNYFYVNTDVFKNTYLKIDLKTNEITQVDCSQTPNSCNKIELQQYATEGYTIGDNYYIFRDENFKSYIRIFVKKELFIPEMVQPETKTQSQIIVNTPRPKEITITDVELQILSSDGILTVQGVTFTYADSDNIANATNTNTSNKIVITPQQLEQLVQSGSIVIGGTKIILKKVPAQPEDND